MLARYGMLDADALSTALGKLAPPGVLLGYRVISARDEDALLPAELTLLQGRSAFIRRQSGAARIAARRLLSAFDLGRAPLPRGPSGAPIWPAGIVGSLAHDQTMAFAAVAKKERYDALGIDVESEARLPAELVAIVATPKERTRYQAALLETRALFSIKEAIFKALNPLHGDFLDFHDIEVDIERRVGITRHGHIVPVAWVLQPRVVALAYFAANAG